MKPKKEKPEFSFSFIYEGFKIPSYVWWIWIFHPKWAVLSQSLVYFGGHFWTKFKVWSRNCNFIIWILQKYSLYEPKFIYCWVDTKKIKNSFSENSQNWFVNNSKYFLSLRNRKCWNLKDHYNYNDPKMSLYSKGDSDVGDNLWMLVTSLKCSCPTVL